MSAIRIDKAFLGHFIDQLRITMNHQFHENPRDSYRYNNPSCLRVHISTTNTELGDPFTKDQIDLITAHLCSFIHFSTPRAPCMVFYGYLGLKKMIIKRLLTMLM
ncbi:unnamed protein product [Macrosiphum euphorbiae]|uniref:Uncharacterized protein n=1 Tax=Macrosiphum euphorbiae TaxID=13131 RepID=A0AAV0XUF9_9HEMI|nr:unnamed protein product [Macrosiphum euphorbiae]